MSRSPQTFKQRDITRALKGAMASGRDVERAEIDKSGRIIIVFCKPGEPMSHDGSWDKAIADLESQ